MQVTRSIQRQGLFCPGQVIIVAVSGGVDSRVLVEVLKELQPSWQLGLVMAHLNHGLRGEESDRDEAFVRNLGYALGVPVESARLEGLKEQIGHGISLQTLARQRRYEFLEAVRAKHGADLIALGHTRSDQAETLVMRLARGTGSGGMSGMPSARDGRIIRPLLEIGREEVLDFARRRNLTWVEDSSNSANHYLRNRIRHDVMPVLGRLNPRIEVALSQLALISRRDNACLEHLVATLELAPWITRDDAGIFIERKPLVALDDALQYRLLRRLAVRLEGVEEGASRLGLTHLEAGIDMIHLVQGTRSLSWPGGLVLTVTPAALWLSRGTTEVGEYWAGGQLQVPGSLALPENRVLEATWAFPEEFHANQVGADSCWLEADVLEFPLSVRYPQRGDRFHPQGSPGETRLSQFFIRQKVPKHERCRTPVVLSGEHIIWVAGLRSAEKGKLTENSRRVVRLELRM